MKYNLRELIEKENIRLNMRYFKGGASLCDSEMTISDFLSKCEEVATENLSSKDNVLEKKSRDILEILNENKLLIGDKRTKSISAYEYQIGLSYQFAQDYLSD